MKARNRAPAVLALLAIMSVTLTACGGSGPGAAVVPTLGNAAQTTTGGAGPVQAAALAAAAQCIRQHGIPAFQDPVLTSTGQVYLDIRSIQDAAPSAVQAVRAACTTLLRQAGVHLTSDPHSEPPAPPQLVQAGVRAAECARANGLPNMADPSSRTLYTPGHGFLLTASEIPAGGKASPVFQRARQVCASQFDAEIRASALSSLASDG
jgi:hypothetical protein